MSRPSVLASSIATALLAFSASTATAAVVTGTSSDFGFSWSAPAAGSPYTLTGTGFIDVTGFNATTLTLNVTLTNTTNSLQYPSDQVRLTAFGFGIDPNATGVVFSDGDSTGMVGAELSAIPSQKDIEVCAFGGQNCPGGSNGGIFGDGGTDTFTLTITGNFSGGTVTLDPLGYKYQTNFGSFEFSSTGSPSSTGIVTSTGVPEPGSTGLALLGLALVGAGFLGRKQQSKLTAA